MELKRLCKTVFSVLIIFILISTNHPALTQDLYVGEPIAKTGHTTLHINDEVEAYKFFHQESAIRKKYLAQTSSATLP